MYVWQWLEGHSRLRPDRIAVVDRASGRRISYAELHAAAERWARWLAAEGLRAGDRLAILSANCPEMLELLFACARTGVVMVPLNYRLAVPELRGILADCAPRMLLLGAGAELAASGREAAGGIPAAGMIGGAMGVSMAGMVGAAEVVGSLPAPSDPLLILYTGGTTGTPKGAILTQETVQWNAWNTIAGWDLGPEHVAPVFTPFFHTGGLNVLATPLLCRGGTVVLPAGGSFDAAAAIRLIEEESCTHVFMVPTMLAMVQASGALDGARLGRVRAFISGGAPCPQALMEAWHAAGLPLRQGYGLTEAGPNTFGCEASDAARRPGTVGRPLPHVRVRLAREDGTEAGLGEPGEVLIAGSHVTPGYWQRPRESAEALRGGWLHTGDLARRDEDGFYYVCGRRKEMFISGGENVFPAEVEEVLAAHPEVAEAAVVGVPDERWGEVGRAFVVARCGAALDGASLLEWCRGRLGRYKVPKEVHVLEALPKSPAGKVLKRELVSAESSL